MKKNYHFLDIEINKPIYRKLSAIQYDNNSRYILVSVYSNFKPYDLTYSSVKIYGIKKDKTVFFNNAKILDAKAGKFEIDLTEQCLAVEGDVEIQSLILGANKGRLSSNSFILSVKPSLMPLSITSQPEWGILTQGLSDLAEYDIYKNGVDRHEIEIADLKQNKANISTIYYYNVKDFGAKGNANYLKDGVYYVDKECTVESDDDTLAFNNALLFDEKHIEGNNTGLKRSVYIPEGNFLIKGTVYVRKGQHLKGCGIGSTRILIPSSEGYTSTFLMGRNTEDIADSGGLAPTISDLSTEGGYVNGVVFDCGVTAGISLYNLFSTTAGTCIKATAGDLNAYNLTIDMCQKGIDLGGSSRNVITASSFFWNGISVECSSFAYDTIISDCNFAFTKVSDFMLKSTSEGSVKNVSIRNSNFVGNGQYETFSAAIMLYNTHGYKLNISDCVFNNLNGYAIAHNGTSSLNTVNINNCVFDGERTHHKYIQGSNSKGILIGDNNFSISNCIFRNLKGLQTIKVVGETGKLIVNSCMWENIKSDYFIEYANAGVISELNNNCGDNLTPIINLFANANVKIGKNYNWLGKILTDGDKKYIKIPSFGGDFNSILKITACTNPEGSAYYRATSTFNICRYTNYTNGAVSDYVCKQILFQTPKGDYSDQINIDVNLDTTKGHTIPSIVKSRYICVSFPANYTYVQFDIC